MAALQKTILIAGASGVVGRAAVEYFAGRPECSVLGVSRRAPLPAMPGARWRSLDLQDTQACQAAAAEWRGVTHLVFAALYEQPGLVAGWREQEQMQRNLAMLANLLGPLERAASGLRHVTLLQGTKAYGVHLHALKVPARERDTRDNHDNFYWLQEDFLRRRRAGKNWRFTILRPQIVFGHAVGGAMNLLAAIGVYGAILKARGENLHWPGGAPYVSEAVDADLLARAIAWSGANDSAGDEIFNVANGDVMVWQNLWPAIAQALGMVAGENRPLKLGEQLAAWAPIWADIAGRRGLLVSDLAELVGQSLHYADFCFAHGRAASAPPVLVSTVKLRQAGFHDCVDTEEMFARHFKRLLAMKLLP